MRILSTAILLCASTGVASANAFLLNDFSAKATGRARASIATTNDASSIVYNVGGIAAAPGTSFYIGTAVILATGSFQDARDGEEYETDNPPAILPAIYLTHRILDKVVLGIGFHTPFGSRIVWPDGSPTLDEVREQSLRTYFITPSIGVDLSKQVPGLRLGAGLDLVPATTELKQDIYFGDVAGSVHLGGNAFGIGGRVGVTYNPAFAPRLSFGAYWRSQVQLDFEGEGDFDIAEPFRGQLPPDGDIKTSITLPQAIGVGMAVRPSDNLEVEANALWVGWSSVDELVISLPGGAETVSPRAYEDRVTLSVGGEWHPNQKLALRAGYIYDPTPIPSTTLTASLPDINRHVLTGGFGYGFGKMAVDLGLLWVMPGDKDTSDEVGMPNYKGQFGVTALVGNVSLRGHFGGE